MLIQVGYELVFNCPQETPMILMVNIHYSRAADIVTPDLLTTDPATHGHRVSRRLRKLVQPHRCAHRQDSAERYGVVRDSAQPDASSPFARQHALQDLPEETLVFLLGSRYCETDLLTEVAWSRFGQSTPGWPRVQAICDFVHNHIAFNYQNARPTGPPGRRLTSARESAGTMRTWPSHFAAA